MSTFSNIAVFQGAFVASVAISNHVLHVAELKVGVSTNQLTASMLDNLKTMQDGSDFSTGVNAHVHDGRYFTEAELSAEGSGTSGASYVHVENKAYANVGALANYKLQTLLDAIHTALAGIGAVEFDEATFRVYDTTNTDRKAAISVARTSTGVSTVTVGDSNVNLDDVPNALLKDGSRTATGNLNMGGFKVTNAGDGTNATDLVTKQQLDAQAAGLKVKNPVRVRTTADLTATYDNGTGGVGATLTGPGVQAISTVAADFDGITLVLNDRVLVMQEGAPAQNGIYYVSAVGDGATVPWVLTRATDADGSPSNEVETGMYTSMLAGTLYARYSYMLTTTGTITIGTTSQTFEVFRLPDETTASGFLEKTGADITLKNLSEGRVIVGHTDNIATAVDTNTVGDIDASTAAGLVIKALAVTTAKINDDAVTTDKIAPSAVTGTELANAAVSTAKLVDDSVTKAKLNADVAGTGMVQDSDGSLRVEGTVLRLTNGNAGTLSAGTIVRISAADTFDEAGAANETAARATFGVLLENTLTGVLGKVQITGLVSAPLGGGSFTVKNEVYLSTTLGQCTQTAPSADGNVVFLLGYAMSANSVLLQPHWIAKIIA